MDEVVLPAKAEQSEYVVDGVPVVANVVESDVPDSGDCNSMSFNLQTSGLAVQIQTKTSPNAQLADLQSKFEFALAKLSECEHRLDAAMRRIGYLEAQLEMKREPAVTPEQSEQ